MKDATRIGIASLMLAIAAISAGCVVAGPGYHEGYYDRDHHRYWHENSWVVCGDRDDHCR